MIILDAKPLYSFGYGLSYSSFDYNNLEVSVAESSDDVVCAIQFEVMNTSSRDGDEVPQVYIVDEVSSVVTPIMQLKAFERKNIKAGRKQQFRFQLSKKDLQLWSQNRQWITEKGKYKVMIGKSSDNIVFESSFTIAKDYIIN